MIDRDRLAASLKQHEGVRLKLYYDTAIPPRATIGVGHNLTDNGISQRACNLILDDDIDEALSHCEILAWFAPLDPVRQNVIVELVFNMGLVKLLRFIDMIAALRAKDWPRASAELVNSTWATQVGVNRTRDLSNMLLYGEWQ